MKKKIISILLAVIMLFAMMPFSSAANEELVTTEIIDLGDGFTVEVTTTTTVISQSRARTNTARGHKHASAKYYTQTIGSFDLYGNFSYDGSSVWATSDSCIASPVSGYSYEGKGSSHSGATVDGWCTFTGKGAEVDVSLSMTCDRNGNIS